MFSDRAPLGLHRLRVLVVDPHEIVRKGLRTLLHEIEGIDVVGEAVNTASAVQRAADALPDVVIADVTLPGIGMELIPQVRDVCPQVRVLVFTSRIEPGFVRSAIDAGVAGYALKQSDQTVLRDALESIARARTYVDPELERFTGSASAPTTAALSEREREVVGCVAAGYCNKEIAAHLNVSVKTVETYRYRAVQKLGLHDRSDLVRYALDRGWLAKHHHAA